MMRKTCLFAALLALGCLALPGRMPAPIVVKQDEGVSFQAPGAEPEVPNQKDAQSQFDAALAREKAGSTGSAIAGYKKTVKRFPKTDAAPAAQYKIGELCEKQGDYTGATKAYEKLIKDYPRSSDFNNALEGVFRIGSVWLNGARQKFLGVPTLPSMDKAVTTYAIILRNAPYSHYAPQAQFFIGQAREKQNDLKSAIAAYQVVVDKYPTDPAAADALYQIGFCQMAISRSGSYDRVATQRARESFEDFLASYPNNEKAAQARDNLSTLTLQQTGGSLKIAQFYDKQKMYRAAIVYYNDTIRQQPNSPESEKAKARLDALRAKLGEAAFTANSAPPTPTAGGAVTAAAPGKPGDGRLQAQTDTARRPDYVGPPVSAPTPPPAPPPVADQPATGPGRGDNGGAARPEATPLPVPEGEQPVLPTQ